MLQDLKFADSLDPERIIGEYSYVELADPPEGDRSAGWPRLLIENRAYCTRVFRKLHLELAARQDGLQACLLSPVTPSLGLNLMCICVSQPQLCRVLSILCDLNDSRVRGQCTGVHGCAKDSLPGMVEHV